MHQMCAIFARADRYPAIFEWPVAWCSRKIINLVTMKTLSQYVLLAAMSALAVGCGKDKDPTPPTKTELLTAKSWRISGAVTVTTTTGQPTTTVDDFATARACEKDDFIKFNTDKTARFDQGPLVCQGSQQTETGAWDFNSDQTKLTLGAAGSSVVGQYNLAELSATTLKISESNIISPTKTEVSTLTFNAF